MARGISVEIIKNPINKTSKESQVNQNDPSAVAVKNDQMFGLEHSFESAKLVIGQVPWDVTTSYRPGTVQGPQAILEASYQLDLVSPILEKAWLMPTWTAPFPKQIQHDSQNLRQISAAYIHFLENGGNFQHHPEWQEPLQQINKACLKLAEDMTTQTQQWLQAGKKVLTLGGDHAISYGPIKAYQQQYSDLSILHFDAHADLRKAYEDFEHSHASIMYNVMENLNIHSLVQVGIRDVSPVEMQYAQENSRIAMHLDWHLKNRLAQGQSWLELCQDMIRPLSQNVYISFDIDGLDPKLCPNTGTPVPGGLELWQVQFLIETVLASGRKIVGADLVEVAPGAQDSWDGNVGARCAFMLACAILKN